MTGLSGGGGSGELIVSGSASAVAALEMLDGVGGVVFDDTYATYQLELSSLVLSASAIMQVQLSVSSAYLTSNYGYGGAMLYGTYSGQAVTAASAILLNKDSLGLSKDHSLTVVIHGSRQAKQTFVSASGFRRDGSVAAGGSPFIGGGTNSSVAKNDGFKLYPSTGTFSAEWALYGKSV